MLENRSVVDVFGGYNCLAGGLDFGSVSSVVAVEHVEEFKRFYGWFLEKCSGFVVWVKITLFDVLVLEVIP